MSSAPWAAGRGEAIGTILVVDDRSVNRKVLASLLRERAYRVHEAADGAEALAMMEQVPPDLVITDLMMPTMDGFELLRRVRADRRLAATPVVFYSASYTTREAEQMAKLGGVTCFVSKLSEPLAILAEVERILGVPAPDAPPPIDETFDRAHLRLVSDKLTQKVSQLEATNLELAATVDRLQALVRIDRAVVAAESPAEIAAGALADVQRLVPFRRVGVSVFDQERAVSNEIAARLDGDPVDGVEFALAALHGPSEGIAPLREGRSLRRRVAELDLADDLAAHGASHWTFLPLIAESELLGTLNLCDDEPIEVAGKMLDVLTTVANQLAIALHQAELRKHLRDYATQLEERDRLSRFTADLALNLAGPGDLRTTLDRCCTSIVEHLDAAFARVWTVGADGDTLELQASAGMYTHVDGGHARVPIGKFKIGLIAAERRPHLTNDVVGDPRVGDQEWAEREGMVSFAGYPLIAEDTLVGVVAMFARRPLSRWTLDSLGSVANALAVTVRERRALAELTEALRRAEASDRLKTAFLNNISHELRTPLNVVLGLASVLRESVPEEQAEREILCGGIKRGADRLLRTVNAVLDASRLETRTMDYHPEPIRLADAVDEHARALEPSARDKGLSFRVEIAEKDALVLFDAHCLSQTLWQVIENAVKFTIRGGVVVRLDRDSSGCLVVDVEDTGVGIPESFRERLFRPFAQLEAGLTRKFEGSGLGLALAKGLLELGKSSIAIADREGGGTRVRITFARKIELPAGAR